MKMSEPWAIHWFRRDLRITGNKSLREVWKNTSGRVVGVFCFDSNFLSRDDFSYNRFAFFLKTLKKLKEEFNSLGGDLIVVDRLPSVFFSFLVESLKLDKRPLPSYISWNRDYEPFSCARDKKMEELISSFGIHALTARDHLVFEPHEIKKDDGSYYQVYSPFSRKWFELLNSQSGVERVSNEVIPKDNSAYKTQLFSLNWKEIFPSGMEIRDYLEDFEKQNLKHVTIPIPDAGRRVAWDALKQFSKKLEAYNDTRDFPYLEGTSRLSVYLKNGSLTVSQILKYLNLMNLPLNKSSGPNQFLKEIIWREFYYHILYHRPDVESTAFKLNYQNIKWENRSDYFERWKEGTTGFPIVDAGMRELRGTGFMHNRVRMIVASFLVKDLLIDWRWGEKHFMQNLLDGDLAPNNGGWQWAASTGCDSQPYFRIFNPWLQSKKFDPDGSYIKKYIPELRKATPEEIHEPDADRSRWKYPPPIVDHFRQKEKALALYLSGIATFKTKPS